MDKRYLHLTVRAAPELGEGVVVAYASVFGTEYRVGYDTSERIAPGAFADSLKERKAFAIYHEHGWRRGDAPIGVTRKAEEDDKGLRIEAQLWVDDDPKARAVYRSLEAEALREWSIGFLPTEEVKIDGGEVVEVRKADLLEASTVLMGANPDTETVGVRAGACPTCGQAEARTEVGNLRVKLEADTSEFESAMERVRALMDADPEALEALAAATREDQDEDDAETRDDDDEPALVESLDLSNPRHRDLLRESLSSDGPQ